MFVSVLISRVVVILPKLSASFWSTGGRRVFESIPEKLSLSRDGVVEDVRERHPTACAQPLPQVERNAVAKTFDDIGFYFIDFALF